MGITGDEQASKKLWGSPERARSTGWIGVEDGDVDMNRVEEAVTDWIYVVATTTTNLPWNPAPSH
jgi:hypothetical protein